MTAHRYDTLDALRGVAALMVMLFHLASRHAIPQLLPHGYLAVDFFFILSGVVLAHAYESRLGQGLDWRGFVLRRLIRLYPLVLVGAVLGLLVRLARWVADPASVDPLGEVLVAGMLNAGLLPMVYGSELTGRALYPTDGPLWSLCFELLANLAWAALLVRRRTSLLLLVLLGAAVLQVGSIHHYATANVGSDRDTFLAGLPRVTYGFVAGVLLHRVRQHLRAPSGRWVGLALAGLLVLAGSPAPSAAWDMACVFLILPAIVALGMAASSPPGGTGPVGDPAEAIAGRAMGKRIADVLGRCSYPLYVLHYPVLVAVIELARHHAPGVALPWVGAAACAAALMVAWLVLTVYDEPVRAALTSRLGAARAAGPGGVAPRSVA